MAEYNPLAEKPDNPYPAIAADRAKCPVQFIEHDGIKLFQVLGYSELSTMLRDPVTYSSRYSATPSPDMFDAHGVGRDNTPVLSVADPPVHTRQRKLLAGAFSPGRIKPMEPHIADVANALIDELPRDGGRFELIEGWARHLVLQIICELLGVPLADREKFAHWTQVIEEAASSLDMARFAPDIIAFNAYVADQIESRRQSDNPPDDLITALVQVEADGERLVSGEVQSLVTLLLGAGNSTTTNNIGNLVYLLETNPEQKAKLLADLPGMTAPAVEEGLRVDAPIHGLFRTANQDTELGGVQIPGGAQMFACFGGANHDEAAFADPDTFDISRDRGDRSHLAFGSGIHHCIGSNLARLETRVAIQTLYGRLPNLRLVPGQTPHQINPMIFRTWNALEMEYDGPVRPRPA